MYSHLSVRRDSPSKMEALQKSCNATGAEFRPPFTPSNSLISSPLCRSQATDYYGSPVQKMRISIQKPKERSSQHIYVNTQQTMRSSLLKPPRNSRDLASPNSVSSNQQYSMRASSSNISDGSASTPKSNRFSHVKSRIDANNTTYTPSASNVRIFHQPVRVNAQPRVGSLANASHTPTGGRVKIEHHKLTFKSTAKPRVDAKSTVEIPNSEKKIVSQKLSWKAAPRVGSLANANHKPTGGDVKIFHQPLRLDAVQSKVGSLNNANHVPGGGDVKISEYKVRSKSRAHQDGNASSEGSLNSSRRSSSTAFYRMVNGTAKLQIGS